MTQNKILKLFVLSIITANMLYSDELKKLDNVTVTANKVEENIQDIPQSITVIDSEVIEEKGIKTIEDVIKQIPNMATNPDRGVKVNFRGLNASLFSENNPIVVYVDGIPTSYKRAFNASLENVERIEVLRGPQGTLYGKDAIGGVINIITKEPTNETSGSVGFEYGSNNYKRATFNLNTPILKDKLFFNLNSELTYDDGWVTNTYNNDDKAAKENDKNFGASLYYKMTDRLSSRLVLKSERNKNYGFKGYGIRSSTGLDNFNRNTAEKHAFEMPTVEKNTIDSQSFDIKYEADNYTIDSITVHRKAHVDGLYDGDYTSGNNLDNSTLFNDAQTDTYSQEIRISNNDTDGIRWLAGLYLDKEEKKHNKYGSNIYFSGFDLYYTDAVSKMNSNTQAIFGQTMIPLGKQFELTLGGRYQRIKSKIDLKSTGYEYNSKTFSYDYKNDPFDAEKTWNVFIPKIALAYKINDNISTFASISKGYMPGGFNSAPSTLVKEDNTFEPQKSTNYEIGIKGSYEDLIFTASIFRMDIKDIHIYRQEEVNKNIVTYTDNADKAHSQGVEFDFSYFPSDTIEISGAVGIIKTEYDSYNAGNGNDFSGQKIETTPSHTANLSIAYKHPSGFYARTDIRNQGAMYFYDDVSKTFPKENGYTLVDAKIGYKFSDLDVYIYGKNLTDEEYINMYEANNYYSVATFGEPRFFGIGVSYTF